MAISITARFIDTFLKGFGTSMKDRVIDLILLFLTALYWLSTGKLHEHFWEMMAPWIWVMCLIVIWHSIKAAYFLGREMADEFKGARYSKSSIFSPSGQEFAKEINQPAIRFYKAKIYGIAAVAVFLCGLCSYYVFMAAYLKRSNHPAEALRSADDQVGPKTNTSQNNTPPLSIEKQAATANQSLLHAASNETMAVQPPSRDLTRPVETKEMKFVQSMASKANNPDWPWLVTVTLSTSEVIVNPRLVFYCSDSCRIGDGIEGHFRRTGSIDDKSGMADGDVAFLPEEVWSVEFRGVRPFKITKVVRLH